MQMTTETAFLTRDDIDSMKTVFNNRLLLGNITPDTSEQYPISVYDTAGSNSDVLSTFSENVHQINWNIWDKTANRFENVFGWEPEWFYFNSKELPIVSYFYGNLPSTITENIYDENRSGVALRGVQRSNDDDNRSGSNYDFERSGSNYDFDRNANYTPDTESMFMLPPNISASYYDFALL